MPSIRGKLEALFRRQGRPIALTADLTWKCNLACRHCYLSDRSGRGQLDTELLIEALRQGREIGMLYLGLSGGEPLVHPHWFDILQAAKSLSFFTSINSNATLIDEEAAQKIASCGVLSVGVSVYSLNDDVHDAITVSTGSLQRTLAGIKALIAAGVFVTVKTPIMAGYNDTDIDRLIDWVESLGERARHSLGSDISPQDNGDLSTMDLHVSLEQQIENERLLIRRKLAFDPPTEETARLRPQRLGSPPCTAGSGRLHLRPDGLVYPCIELPLVLGDLKKESLLSIWERYKARVSQGQWYKLQDLDGCADCELLDWCEPCMGFARLQHGSPTATPTINCAAAYARCVAHLPEGAPRPDLPKGLRDKNANIACSSCAGGSAVCS